VVTLGGIGSCYASLALYLIAFYPSYKLCNNSAFQDSNVTKVKPYSYFQVPQNQCKSLQLDMQPVHTRPITEEDIQRANKVVAVIVAEITKQYACQGKAQVPPFPRGESSTAQVSENPPPLMPLLV
jgi:hypothetical protein